MTDAPIGNRLMDRAVLRRGTIEYTGEPLLLALLMHTKGTKNRPQKELDEIARLLDDPNLKED